MAVLLVMGWCCMPAGALEVVWVWVMPVWGK